MATKSQMIEDNIDNLGKSFPFSIAISDPSLDDNPLVYINDAFEKLTGYSRGAIIGRNCRFLQGPDTDPETVAKLRHAVVNSEEVEVEIYNYRADGEGFWNRLMLGPIADEDGVVRYFVGIQQSMRRSPPKTEAMSTDDMLAEIQHRVKNHLSMVVGMIRIQAKEAGAKDTFDSLARRVEALQLLYSEMSDSASFRSDPENVSLGAYLSRIASTIVHIDGRRSIRVNVDADAIEVPVETAARAGLIFSELLTNTLQHAFDGQDEGMVEARAKMLSNNVLRLTVMDDGIGIPDDIDWPNEGGLGAKIVRNLVKGLDGVLSVDRDLRGTSIRLDIPLSKQEELISAEEETPEQPTGSSSDLE